MKNTDDNLLKLEIFIIRLDIFFLNFKHFMQRGCFFWVFIFFLV